MSSPLITPDERKQLVENGRRMERDAHFDPRPIARLYQWDRSESWTLYSANAREDGQGEIIHALHISHWSKQDRYMSADSSYYEGLVAVKHQMLDIKEGIREYKESLQPPRLDLVAQWDRLVEPYALYSAERSAGEKEYWPIEREYSRASHVSRSRLADPTNEYDRPFEPCPFIPDDRIAYDPKYDRSQDNDLDR